MRRTIERGSLKKEHQMVQFRYIDTIHPVKPGGPIGVAKPLPSKKTVGWLSPTDSNRTRCESVDEEFWQLAGNETKNL